MRRPEQCSYPLALVLLLACTTLPAWPLDLAQVYRLALEQDASIRAARATAEAGRERLPQARSQLFPTVSATASRSRNDLETTAPGLSGRSSTTNQKYTSSNETLTLRQPLFRKQLTAQYRQAHALVASSDANLERELQNLVIRVTQAYLETLQADEQVVLIHLQKTAYTTQLDAARKGFSAGAGTRTDIDEAQARLDLSLAQELEARQGVALARRQLQVLINQPVDQVAPIDVQKLELSPPIPDSVEQWTRQAEEFSPEIQSLNAQFEAARYQVEKAEAGHYPTLDAVAELSRSSNDNITRINSQFNQKQIGLQLAIPIFQGGFVNSQVREALAELARAENALEAGRRDLGVRVHREFRGVVEGVLRVRALEQAVRSAAQLAVSSKRSFEAGARTRVDILNAEQQLGTARRDLAQARFAYLLARVRLRALTGSVMPDTIDEINGWLQR